MTTIQELHLAGVRFIAEGLAGEWFNIPLCSMEEYMKDPCKWLATQGDMTVDDYLYWQDFDGRCAAKTKRGQRCKNSVYLEFGRKRGYDDLCRFHQIQKEKENA